jgi:hypothetical protein
MSKFLRVNSGIPKQAEEGSTALTSNLADTSSSSNGDALIGFKQPLSGAVAGTVHSKLLEIISIKDFGAVGDGSTNDNTAISAALSAIGSSPYRLSINFPLKFSGNLTFPANIQLEFYNDGRLIGTSGTEILTLNGPVIAPLKQIFSTCAPTFGYGTKVYPEWFGAVGDGSTDDYSAIQASVNSLASVRGTVMFGPKSYKMGTVVNITSSNLGLQGEANWATRIIIPGASQSAFQFLGTNSSNKINHNFVADMFIYKSVTATGGIGIVLSHTAIAHLRNLQISDFGYGVKLANATNTLTENVICTNSSGTFGFRGFYLDGTDPNGNVSSMFRDCAVDAAGNTGNSYGFYSSSGAAGGNLNDVYFDNCATASCKTGYYFDLASQLTGAWGDIMITNPIVDFYTDYGIFIANSPVGSAITITGGWIDAKPLLTETDAIVVYNSSSVTIAGTQFWCDTTSNRNTYGIKLISSLDTLIKGCVFYAHKYGVYSDASSFCTVTDNKFSGPSGFATSHIFLDTTTNNFALSSNILDGYATNGIAYGASTYRNTAVNSKFSANITTGINDLGSNGALALGSKESDWGTTVNVVEVFGNPFLVGQNSSALLHIGANYWFDRTSSDYTRKFTGYASDHYHLNGDYVWRSSTASGSAGTTVTSTGGWREVLKALQTGNVLIPSGSLGIGTANPDSPLTVGTPTSGSATAPVGTKDIHVVNPDSTNGGLTMDSFGTSNIVSGRRAQGTSASKTALVNTAIALRIAGYGWDGTSAYGVGGAIDVVGTGTWSSTSYPTKLSFKTVNSGSTTLTERMVLDGVGNLGIGVTPASRNNTCLEIKDGIGFPATQVASSDANTLDDYEEGTFTPTVTTGAGSITSFGTKSGIYTKIGDTVTVTVTIPITNNGTGANDVRVTNMPFASNTISQCGSGREMQSWGYQLYGYINGGSTTLVIYKTDAASGAYPGGTNYTINFTITYKL